MEALQANMAYLCTRRPRRPCSSTFTKVLMSETSTASWKQISMAEVTTQSYIKQDKRSS